MEVQHQVVLFRRARSTRDFSCSERFTLPGRHTAHRARDLLHDALRTRSDIIGGELVQAFAETDAERDEETLLNSERRS